MKKIMLTPTGRDERGILTNEQIDEARSRMTEEDRRLFVEWFTKWDQTKPGTRPLMVEGSLADEVKTRMDESKQRLNVSNRVFNDLMVLTFFEYMEPAKKMRAARMSAGLSQSALAEKSGVSVRMIQYYEQGVKELKKAQAITVLNLARALGCTVEDLIA